MPTSIRRFETGATRDTAEGKLDYEAFLSPLVLRRYAEYLHKHRIQPDGQERPGDNWQKGIPPAVYMKSWWRHFMDCWLHHRGWTCATDPEESLCAALFNNMGLLHERLAEKESAL